MRVLLINPPYPFEESPTPPFGLISLAAYLLEQGVEVRIEDYIVQPYGRERIRAVLEEYRPRVVGSTAVTMNVKAALRILGEYKEENPELVTVIGGPHVSFDADNILLRNRQVDYIVRGEGEITFTELLGRLNEGKAADGVAGISYRANGGVTHAPDRPLIPDINILPQPARHLVSLSKYRALGFPINMVTSRGCPNKCIFCVGSRMVGRKVRHFDVERVVDEFETLSKMKFFQINVVDDLFTTNKKRCMAICDEIIRRGIKHRWVAFARVDTVSRDLLVRMKEAGCTTLCFGVESGNQEILDAVKKNITLEKAREAVALCNEVGMEPMTSYILGLPGDSYETVKRTMQFARNLSPMYGFHILAPFPGTEVREKANEYGITILTDDWDLYDANQSVSGTGLIPPEEIDRLVREFNSGINRYVTSLGQKKQRGETLPEKDENIIRGIVSFDFTQKLLLGEFVERYPGMRNGAAGDGLTRDFVRYLQAGLDFPPDQVSHEVDRLFNLGCLTIEEAGGRCTVIWA
jgi:anaerobic magnesium-protoporphyrin IX monomethyl ester cyclase